MQDLIDIINKLAEKYKFEQSDIKEVQDAIFALENGRDEKESLEVEDFQTPEGYDEVAIYGGEEED